MLHVRLIYADKYFLFTHAWKAPLDRYGFCQKTTCWLHFDFRWFRRWRNTAGSYHVWVRCGLAGWRWPTRPVRLATSPPLASRRPSPEIEPRLSPKHVAPSPLRIPSSQPHLAYAHRRIRQNSTLWRCDACLLMKTTRPHERGRRKS